MSAKTSIEWTDATWNPVRGCSRVSEGCRNCYAESVAHRFSGPGQSYEGLTVLGMKLWNGQVRFIEEHLLDPLRWKAPRRIFVNSMSDLFHENSNGEWVDKIFAVMALSPQHTFQILTKRPERMQAWFRGIGGVTRRDFVSVQLYHLMEKAHRLTHNIKVWPLPNVWLGVSCEDQKTADERIPLLLQTPAAVRFISAEPLLGPIDLHNLDAHSLSRAQGDEPSADELEEPWKYDSLTAGDIYWGGSGGISDGPEHYALDWVIVGGESGPGARPMHPDWARGLRDQCEAAGVAYFFKQWGEYASASEVSGPGAHFQFPDGATVRRVGKHKTGALLDGREWREFPL